MKLIQSRDNPFYRQLRKLAESGRERRKQGLSLLDGEHLIDAWTRLRGPVDTLILAESIWQAAGQPEGEGVVLGDALMRDLGLVDTPSGHLALVTTPAVGAMPDHGIDTVLLDGVQDPGNVGTLLRTAAAAGVRQVLLSPGCAAAWSPKVLRAGQGAHFALAVHEEADLEAFVAAYRGGVAVTCLEGASSLFETEMPGAVAWVFGAEGAGVRPALIEAARWRICIPMPGAVESLNVSAAAAICLFDRVRRQGAGHRRWQTG